VLEIDVSKKKPQLLRGDNRSTRRSTNRSAGVVLSHRGDCLRVQRLLLRRRRSSPRNVYAAADLTTRRGERTDEEERVNHRTQLGSRRNSARRLVSTPRPDPAGRFSTAPFTLSSISFDVGTPDPAPDFPLRLARRHRKFSWERSAARVLGSLHLAAICWRTERYSGSEQRKPTDSAFSNKTTSRFQGLLANAISYMGRRPNDPPGGAPRGAVGSQNPTVRRLDERVRNPPKLQIVVFAQRPLPSSSAADDHREERESFRSE